MTSSVLSADLRFGDPDTQNWAQSLFRQQYYDHHERSWPNVVHPGEIGFQFRDCHRCGSPRVMILGERGTTPVRQDASCGWKCSPDNCPVCRIASLFPNGRIRARTPIFPFNWREGLAAAGVDVPLFFSERGPRYRPVEEKPPHPHREPVHVPEN
ncbi:hypothetical protein [Kitasatospora sp. NPDC094016]|uniref:hypothetical protein n=1 Tax=Kitasatospora sp. NPDC094016 TaxID=3154986 RepID=UPI003323CB91